MAERAFQNILSLERQLQASVFSLFRKAGAELQKPVGASPVPPPVSESATAVEENDTPTAVALTPVDANGFYKVTGPTEVTFYATTEWPNLPVGLGWTGDGFLGIQGQIQITGATNVPGPGYLWSFTLQTDTDQSIQGTQQAIGATLYPPTQIQYSNKRVQVPLFGYYTVRESVPTFYFTAPPPGNLSAGWIVTGLPTIRVPLTVTSYSQNLFSTNSNQPGSSTFVTLRPVDGLIPPENYTPVYVSGVPALIQEPAFTTTFVPGKFTSFTNVPKDLSQLPPVTMPSSISIGNYPEQRELNSDTSWNLEPTPEIFPPSEYKESRGKGFSSGSILSLEAIGPQEKYLLTDDLSKSQWNPAFKRYSNFVMYQKVYPFPPPSPVYQGQTVQIELRPTELGHLLSNMYLSVTLPALPNGCNYTSNVGRALIKQIDLLVNETIVETLYDDWYVIRDQLFLDADEQLGLQVALSPQNAQTRTYLGTGGDSTIVSGSNIVHTFLQSNTFNLSVGTYATILVVGGGGSGASGLYTSNLSSNIAFNSSVSGPITFTAPVESSIGAYVGANAYITTQGTTPFTTNIYVSSFTATSITFTTFGTLATWSNLLPSGNTVSVFNGNGGGGGGVYNQTIFLPAGNYSVAVGSGGTTGGNSSLASPSLSFVATGGSGGALGGASGSGFTSNTSYQYFSNIVYQSGGGAASGANVTTNTAVNAFTNVFTLGRGGNGYAVSNTLNYSNLSSSGVFYVGGGGGGASNTSIVGTLVTPGGLGGGAGSSNISGTYTAAVSGTVNTGGGGGGSFIGTPGAGGSGRVVISYTSNSSVVPQSTITIPLEFFFCRRHSHNNRGRERLRRPYFPVCAMWNQRLYVRFTFNPNTWWCNSPVANNTDLYPPVSTLWPNLITEEVLLENAEKLYYTNTPLKYIVNRVQKESPQFFNSQTIQLNFTANYPVQTLAWFFRNKAYETTTDGRYYNFRYSYGYTTQYIKTGVQLYFPSGTSNYVDVIETAKITLNNVDILSTFQGSLYYTFKQPMEHALSIPSKNIYTYSFGLTPKEYNQGGYLNFSKLVSQTTYLQLTFLPQYTDQIIQGYNLYLYYYGYTLLQFQGGFASLPFL